MRDDLKTTQPFQILLHRALIIVYQRQLPLPSLQLPAREYLMADQSAEMSARHGRLQLRCINARSTLQVIMDGSI